MKSQSFLCLIAGLALLVFAGCEGDATPTSTTTTTSPKPAAKMSSGMDSVRVELGDGEPGSSMQSNQGSRGVNPNAANAGAADAGAADAGAAGAGTNDAGTSDTGSADAADAGSTDAGTADAGTADASAEKSDESNNTTSSDPPSNTSIQGVGEHDWPQWGGSTTKNNTPEASNIPAEFDPGEFDRATGEWIPGSGMNVKWVSRLGSQSYGNPVVANGQVYVGTNNGAGYLERYPYDVDLGVLACFRESDGEFLWQHSSEKLIIARVQDWPLQGICCAPCVDGDRLWFVTSRGVVACLDTQGFRDGENDGPYTDEEFTTEQEADTVWEFDMLKEIQLFQHNMCACSVTVWEDYLFVNTSNGVDESHINIPSPDAPSFMALNKNTGELLWTDNSPGINIVHGQWSSPTFAVINGQPQVIFPGGDGYVRSFDPAGDGEGNSKLLWKFDCNPKESKWILGGRGTRNNIIGTVVVYDDKCYVAVGQDPEHGEGGGHLWCIDPTKSGDISPSLVFDADGNPVPHRRLQAAVPEDGEIVRDNPNSGAIWHYSGTDINGDGELEWEEEMHRSVATVAIKDDILYIADFSGLFHCVNAQTGEAFWTHDMLAAAWGSALIVDGKVYVGDEDGDIMIFEHNKEKNLITEDINMSNAVYSTPIVANGVLYIANKSHLFAIVDESAKSDASTGEPAQK